MARVLADTTATITLTVTLGGTHLTYLYDRKSPEERKRLLADAATKIERLVKVHVVPEADHLGGCHIVTQDDFKCSNCGRFWTEKSATYNGGCCEEDEKHAPQNEVAAS